MLGKRTTCRRDGKRLARCLNGYGYMQQHRHNVSHHHEQKEPGYGRECDERKTPVVAEHALASLVQRYSVRTSEGGARFLRHTCAAIWYLTRTHKSEKWAGDRTVK